MGDVVEFSGDTSVDIPASKILDAAPRDLSECVILGWDNNDNLYLAGTTSDIGKVLLLLEISKQELLKQA